MPDYNLRAPLKKHGLKWIGKMKVGIQSASHLLMNLMFQLSFSRLVQLSGIITRRSEVNVWREKQVAFHHCVSSTAVLDSLSIRGWYLNVSHMLGILQHYFFIFNVWCLNYFFLNNIFISLEIFQVQLTIRWKLSPATFVPQPLSYISHRQLTSGNWHYQFLVIFHFTHM